MKIEAFRAVCPVEIGDEVFVIGDKAYYLVPGTKATQEFLQPLLQQGDRRKIEDIATVMHCKSGNIEFGYKLSGKQEYRNLDVIAIGVSNNECSVSK